MARRTGWSAGAKGNTEALFQEPEGRVGEAREVQKTEIGSFWKGVWFSSPASTGEGGEGSAVPFAPTPVLSRVTDLISEWPLMKLVCTLFTKFFKLSDLRQTQFSLPSVPSPQ